MLACQVMCHFALQEKSKVLGEMFISLALQTFWIFVVAHYLAHNENLANVLTANLAD